MSHPSIALVLLAIALAAAPSPAARAEGRYALLVGVEKYDPSELAPLDYAEDDVEAMGRALGKLGFSVVTMTSSAEIAARRPVLRDDILTQVDRRLADLEKPDTVVLAFSGHGVQLKGDQADSGGAKELWFCPERARPGDPKSLVPMSEVIGKLEKCAAGRKLLLVDACRNEFEPPNGSKSGRVIELPAAGVKRPPIPSGMVAMFSCRPGEQSFEIKDLHHSIFSHHVIEFLEGRAPADRYPRGEVGITELTTYVRSRTKDLAYERLDKAQVPDVVLPDRSFGEWPLGRLGEGPAKSANDLASVERRPVMERPAPSVPPVAPAPRPGPKPAVPPGRRGALLIGVERYAPDELPSLDFSDEDAKGVAQALTALGYSTVAMTSSEDSPRQQPRSAAEILAQVDTLAANREKEDTIVFGFFGHGVALKGSNDVYLCPQNAKLSDRTTLCAMSDVLRRIRKSKAGNKVLFIDAARNGINDPPMTKQKDKAQKVAARNPEQEGSLSYLTPGDSEGRTNDVANSTTAALLSCQHGEGSFELNSLQHSVFAHHVIAFLLGKAPEDRYPSGKIKLGELASYVRARTRDDVDQQLGARQTPELVSDGEVATCVLGSLDALR